MDQHRARAAYRIGIVAEDLLSDSERAALRNQGATALERLRALHLKLGFDPLECSNAGVGGVDRDSPGLFHDEVCIGGDVASIQGLDEACGFVDVERLPRWAAAHMSTGVVSHRSDPAPSWGFWGRRYYASLEQALAVESILSISLYAVGEARGADLPGVLPALREAMAHVDAAPCSPESIHRVAAALSQLPGTVLEFKTLREEVVQCWYEDSGRKTHLLAPGKEAFFNLRPHLHRLRSVECDG